MNKKFFLLALFLINCHAHAMDHVNRAILTVAQFVKSVSARVDQVKVFCLPGFVKNLNSSEITKLRSELDGYEFTLHTLLRTTDDFVAGEATFLELRRINRLNYVLGKPQPKCDDSLIMDWSKVK